MRALPPFEGRGWDSMDEDGKLVHHRCGYALWMQVIGQAEWAERVMVEYRDGYSKTGSLPLYACPECGKRLKLWWQVSQSGGQDTMEVYAYVRQ